ncbi:uncharacterized protein LTR77_003720 [Saxophila tyrrhenica]|uniref:Uncharacterized protein n=1 Tax=Saxophila tyrrhenica TaxID=1690608 RepID=A0AAV9PEL2_9PEZI|nr:hypothetical protein LTR77_003720 [Saxophila tyrrhenica]
MVLDGDQADPTRTKLMNREGLLGQIDMLSPLPFPGAVKYCLSRMSPASSDPDFQAEDLSGYVLNVINPSVEYQAPIQSTRSLLATQRHAATTDDF